jgi:hypothetical protein
MPLPLLAQGHVDLSNLEFLRLPQQPPEMLALTVGVLLLVLVTVMFTLSVQRAWQRWVESRPARKAAKAKAGPKLNERQQAALDLLRFYTEPLKLNALLTDPRVFEAAVEKALPTASEEDVADITALRRHLRMTVMNHDLDIVSTRQLLEGLGVRIIASVGGERLDLYCSLLEVNERFLLIDLPYQEDIYRLLMQHPQVTLVYWGEESGEALFDITLEAIQQGTVSIFRAGHALRDPDATQRADFRLTVDIPVHYACVTREQLVRHKETGAQVTAIKGEGRLIDLSHGGGALVTQAPLPEQGITQLTFRLDDQPVRMMLEVLAVHPAEGGRHVARGRFRGAQPESRSQLESYLSREQINRLRNKETILTKMAG